MKKILPLLLFILFIGSSCADKVDQTYFDSKTYQKDLQKFYEDGLIDSAEKRRAERYITRALNIGARAKEDGYDYFDHPEFFSFFSTNEAHPVSYRKLIDSNSLATKAWPGKKIVRAVAISYNYGDSTIGAPFIPKDTSLRLDHDDIDLNYYTISSTIKQVELTPQQIQELLDDMNGYRPVGSYPAEGTSDCFMPYNGIILYGEKDEYVAYIEICFYCRGFHIHPKTLRKWDDKSTLKKMKIDEYISTMHPFRRVFAIPDKK